jgi:hypothetical protein
MTATLFIGFVMVVAAAVVLLIARYVNWKAAIGVLAALCFWFIFAGLLGSFGVLRNTTVRPPGIAFVVVPVFVFLIVFIASASTRRNLTNKGGRFRRCVAVPPLLRRP